jgi:hypothetical protein
VKETNQGSSSSFGFFPITWSPQRNFVLHIDLAELLQPDALPDAILERKLLGRT